MPKRIDLTNKRYGKLLVIEFAGYGLSSRPQWKCICDCGSEIITYTRYLTRGTKDNCGCETKKKISKKTRKGYGESLKNRVMDAYRRSAKLKDVPFSLSNEEMERLFSGNCYYCNNEPLNTIERKGFYGSFTYNGIDRLSPDLGYVMGNVVSCCQACNFMKNSYTESEFLNIIDKIAKNHNLGGKA